MHEASAWRDKLNDDRTTLSALLLGVLAESESRGADILRQHAVTDASVLARWPNLKRCAEQSDPQEQSEGAVAAHYRAGLRGVEDVLFDFPRPIEIATEHLLLGLLLAQDPVSEWLSQQGLSAEALADDIRRWLGWELDTGRPIDLPQEDELRGSEIVTAPSELPAAGDVDMPVLRILDASANRAREGIRVVEDYARFVLNDARLCRALKQFRHDFARACSPLPVASLLRARDTEHDVGTAIVTATEQQRGEPRQVALASWKRLQEALRSLEEYGKLISPEIGATFEQLRYRSYTLERDASLAPDRCARLANCRLYVLIDARDQVQSFRALASSLIEAGVHVLQLREKRLDDRTLLARAVLLRELTVGSDTLFIMNDRPDIARLAEADGVHVGQEELPIAQARTICGAERLVGASTHSLSQARQAVIDGADYVGVGPTFPSQTKQFADFTGTQLLREVASEISLPAFAIGGITLDNLDQVLAAGFTRVAVSSAIVAAERPAQTAREFLRRLAS